ncbi:response regulator transcription factor [Methylobacterium sp. V23]|uniref:response regulator n=1 Tax=Methylobacterium sp. V23 TaxID=2044878 RepID=UPI000CDA856C|nr:response regulator transcription factor [Methylobacterium sp. V23]POR40171.1 DNA-binding response regulator [Methylobacterium sp. V23]
MIAGRPIRVVVADDHPIVRSGLEALLRSSPDFEVVASCSRGDFALVKIRQALPEVAVLDVQMPGLTGVQVLAALKEEASSTRVILLTASASDEQIATAVELGVYGILLKEAAADELLECIRSVSLGLKYLEGDWVSGALKRYGQEQDRNQAVSGLDTLTPRESQISELVARGMSNKEIARQIGVSDGTVKIHLSNIFQKLNVTNRTALASLSRATHKAGH